MATPVRSATVVGRVSGLRGRPSSQWKVQLVSVLVRPDAASQVKPSMRCALRLARVTRPWASISIRPSAIDSTTAPAREARSSDAERSRAATRRVVATSASRPSSSRSVSSKLAGCEDTAAIRPTATPSCTSGTMIEDRVRTLALMSARVRGSVWLSRHSWPSRVSRARPARVPARGIRWPTGGPVKPAAARATTKSPTGWEAIEPTSGKTRRTASARVLETMSTSGAAQAMSRCAFSSRIIRSRDGVIRAGDVLVGGPRPRCSAGRHGHVLAIGTRRGSS